MEPMTGNSYANALPGRNVLYRRLCGQALGDDCVGCRSAIRATGRTGNGAGLKLTIGLDLECVVLPAFALNFDRNHL